MALAYSFAREHDYRAPDAHFWAIIGDSEFREGSLFEAIPDFAERQLGNLTWIIDYNRQSLDGHRITNRQIMGGNDNFRIERTMAANGWEVIQLQHGSLREKLFKDKGGETFKFWLENELEDYELQALLLTKDAKALHKHMSDNHLNLKEFLSHHDEDTVFKAMRDFGGHDIESLVKAFEDSKRDKERPTIVIAHTLKGWGLNMAAQQANHSALPNADEMLGLRKATGLAEDVEFAGFDTSSAEARFLSKRGAELYSEIKEQDKLKAQNQNQFLAKLNEHGELPHSLDINLKMASYPHTQWMLGQLTSKLTRIANTPSVEAELAAKQKPLTPDELAWKTPAELMVSMAPDVGTSTNLNPTMDGKIFSALEVEDYESDYEVRDTKVPDLIPSEEPNHRYIRFEISEANAISCMGAFGRLRDVLGIPILPLMTVYDFFVKRALDQYFYDLYWQSSFILCGTPSGVTLSPEGAQHGWKSDIQIPNQITWEPFFCVELDWILSDAIRRHVTFDNDGRTGVHIRGVTRGVEQKDLLKYLRTQRRFKAAMPDDQYLCPSEYPVDGCLIESEVVSQNDEEILQRLKSQVLQGAYPLIDYSGYAAYEPGDNVVNIFAMGSIGTEAIKASNELLAKGIYANVIMVTSPDLLVGNIAHDNNYDYLKNGLGVNANLHLFPQLNGNPTASELVTMAGRRVPMVSAHDGEPGLLDNIGSAVGVKHEALAVRIHSRCGRPIDVYQYHHIDSESIVDSCMKVLAETTLEQVQVTRTTLQQAQPQVTGQNWQQFVD